MKRPLLFLLPLCYLIFLCACNVTAQNKSLKLVFIRHAEKSEEGDNLNCQGLNRSMQLPAVLFKKFGKPNNIYVPALGLGDVTKHARMLQTITPFVAKYGLTVNSEYDEDDYKKIGKALLNENGTIIIVWEHKNIPPILAYLGVNGYLNWPDNDFDSIWIVTFTKGHAVMTRDKEHLNPAPGCPF